LAAPDYYELLGVARDADAADIKRAYRQAAVKNHPDRNPGDTGAEERFKQCAEAYQVLSDPEKRSIYDRFGHDGLQGRGVGFGGGGFEDIFGAFGDILGDLFGGGGRGGGRGHARGNDLRYDLQISFAEAVFGCKREISFQRHEPCDRCEGSGAEPGTQPEPCASCRGQGRITRQQGFFMVQTACPVCRGAGRVVTNKCQDCSGEGVSRVERRMTVTIPPGVDNGVRLRLTGEGEAAGRGARGDLYVFIEVAPDERFQREGADVLSAVDLAYSQVALGAEIEVETVHGPETVKVPAGTQPGTVVRLRRKGIRRLNGGGQGDHYVTLSVTVPDKLSRAQKKAVQALREQGL
jgi:molecular chaperone DnaJ